MARKISIVIIFFLVVALIGNVYADQQKTVCKTDSCKDERALQRIEEYRKDAEKSWLISFIRSTSDSRDGVSTSDGMFQIIEGKCHGIDDKKLWNLCMAIKSEKCSSLSGSEQDLCRGITEDRVSLVQDGLENLYPDIFKGIPEEFKTLPSHIGIMLWKYKKYGKDASLKFIDTEYTEDYGFKFLLRIFIEVLDNSSMNRVKILQQYMDDVVLYRQAQFSGQQDLCDNIKSLTIQRECYIPGGVSPFLGRDPTLKND